MTTIRAGKPVNIAGVTIVPKWNWSSWYYAEVRNDLRNYRQGDLPSREYLERQAVEYARYLAARDGIDLSEANELEVRYTWVGEKRVIGVMFAHSEYRHGRRYYSDWNKRGFSDDAERIAYIGFPHAGWRPTATELPEED